MCAEAVHAKLEICHVRAMASPTHDVGTVASRRIVLSQMQGVGGVGVGGINCSNRRQSFIAVLYNN